MPVTGSRGPVTEALEDISLVFFDCTTEDKWGWLDLVASDQAQTTITAHLIIYNRQAKCANST